jgi:hypothetical protein
LLAPTSSPDSFTILGDKALFLADDYTHGRELWVTDWAPRLAPRWSSTSTAASP